MMQAPRPKLAEALLHRFVWDDALVGDLLEEFEWRSSQLWFWRQVLVAIAIGLCRDSRAIRPLRLVDVESDLALPESRVEVQEHRPQTINLTAGVRGGSVGGLGVIALAVLVTLVLPQAWWLLAVGVLGGVLLGTAMVAVGRHRMLNGPSAGGRASVLFGSSQ